MGPCPPRSCPQPLRQLNSNPNPMRRPFDRRTYRPRSSALKLAAMTPVAPNRFRPVRMTPKPPALKMSFDESWRVYAACHAANARQPCGLHPTRVPPRFCPYARGKPARVTSGNSSISGVGLDRADPVHAA